MFISDVHYQERKSLIDMVNFSIEWGDEYINLI